MSLISLRGAEPIAGYNVTERLGAGGYGEVWKAEAPGGLQKAIKFIYGYLNEEKASRELKALNRVKQIRHPFLLSLERIEVVDGQLLIVTELADSSVKDRCQECRQQDLPGIPREELLRLLGDAADALDFLSTNALQHLDVKPENLLLVGGRVKVADFGLVKDIQDHTCSMMGGMTPVYAPPEIFDGRPDKHSDQYSLAIVYQEMLTGVLPFPGATAAQLASQHLHSRPRLESLPTDDRAIVARALSKKPHERFASSRALIDALLAAGHREATRGDESQTGARPANGDTTSCAGQDTDSSPLRSRGVARRGRAQRCGTDGGPNDGFPAGPAAAPAGDASATQVRDLPPLPIIAEEAGLRPTLYLGIGGTAAQVLNRLRRRLSERFGNRASTPLFEMLLIDTDAACLARQSGGADQGGLDPEDLLAMPLRRPEDYRNDTLEILQWLSRRWLYNIPRSLQTEGLRPLGRLALVDHGDELFARVRAALKRMTSNEALADSERNTGLPIRDRSPRVYIVASISGGAGGGMVLDVAYAVRMLLAEMGLPDQGVCGLLTHCTSRVAQGKDLAIANAYACLSELLHYTRGGYPGEPACGIAPFEQRQSPFHTTYFIHMGDRLNDGEFHDAVDGLAEYLHVDAATPGGPFLEKCRAEGAASGEKPLELRTLGIRRIGCQPGLSAQVAEHLCHQLLMRWSGQAPDGAAPTAREARVKRLAAELISEFELDAEALHSRCRQTVEQALSPNARTFVSQVAAEILQQPSAKGTPPAARWQSLTQHLQKALAPSDRPADSSASSRIDLKPALDSRQAERIKEVDRGLLERIVAAADEADVRLLGAQAIADCLASYLRNLDQELCLQGQQLQRDLAARSEAPPLLPLATGRKAAKTPEIAPESQWREALAEHGRLALKQWSLYGAQRFVQALLRKVLAVSEALVGLRRETQRLAQPFAAAPPWGAVSKAAAPQFQEEESVDHAVLHELQHRFEELTSRFDQMTSRELLAPRGGVVRVLSAGEQALRLLPGLLRSMARWEVTQTLKDIDIARLALGPLHDTTAARDGLERFVQAAWPRLLVCGGAKRLLLLMPPCATTEKLPGLIKDHRQEACSVVLVPGGDLVACYEAEQIPLTAAAAELVRDDPQYAVAAHRLHTRTDIQWTAV